MQTRTTRQRQMRHDGVILRLLVTAVLGAAVLGLTLGSARVHAQLPTPNPVTSHRALAPPGNAEETVDPGSPRASVNEFYDLTANGEYEGAARYLDLPDSLRSQGAELARELRAVLGRNASIEPSDLSADARGDTTDDLAPGVDEIARIRGADGIAHPVRLQRYAAPEGTIWRFSRGTVERVHGWYRGLEGRWAFEHLPDPLLRPGPLGILRWQWLVLPGIIILAWLIGWMASRFMRSVLWRAAQRTSTHWDDEVLKRISAPLTLAISLLAMRALIEVLGLSRSAETGTVNLLRAGGTFALFWMLWRLVDVASVMVVRKNLLLGTHGAGMIVPMASRIAKILITAVALASMLSLLGYPVASVIAGLGLGGLAFALAAQKTVENLFGAVTIGVDRPFSVGDTIRVDGVTGTVEEIGLRSSRIRTADRTLITMPNGRLADSRIESLTARDRIRMVVTLPLDYATTAAQMRSVLSGVESFLRAHPRVWPDTILVRLRDLGASALEVEVVCWFLTTDGNEYEMLKQEALLALMDVVESAGTRLAYPSQTVYVRGMTEGKNAMEMQEPQRFTIK